VFSAMKIIEANYFKHMFGIEFTNRNLTFDRVEFVNNLPLLVGFGIHCAFNGTPAVSTGEVLLMYLLYNNMRALISSGAHGRSIFLEYEGFVYYLTTDINAVLSSTALIYQ